MVGQVVVVTTYDLNTQEAEAGASLQVLARLV